MKLRYVIIAFSLIIPLSSFSGNLPADTVLNRVMSAAAKYNELVESFEAEVYTRTYVRTVKKNFLYKYTHFVPRFVLHDPKADEALIETVSTLKYDYPNNYVQDINYVTGTLTRKKDIDMLPFHLLNINIYGETTNDESFFMPLRFSTAKYYNYKLDRTYIEDNKTYYTISYTPIYENPKLLKGSFVVESGTWRITHFMGEGVDILANFSFEITMGDERLTNYLPVSFTIYQTVSYLGNVLANRHLVNFTYKDIRLRLHMEPVRSLNISNFFKVRLDSVPVYSDSVFWDELRPIPLQAREKDVLTRFEQEKQTKQGKTDSLSDLQKTQQFAQRMAMDSRYEYRSTQIGYSGFLNPSLLGYTSRDGIMYRQKLSFHIDLRHNRNVKIDAFAGFAFKYKEFLSDLTTTWNYDPFHLRSVTLSLGNGNPTYSSIFLEQIRDSLAQHGLQFEDISVEYYNDYYMKLFHTSEITNGFLLNAGVEYHIRKGESNTSKLRSSGDDTETIEDMFGVRRSFAPFIRFSWTPEQYYRYEGRQKIYVRSRFPTVKIELSRSFQNILGSTTEYNRMEIDVSQNIPIGLMSSFQYHIGAGKFANPKTEYFADFVYFSKSNFPENRSDKLDGSFNLLGREFYNASDSYIQMHMMLEKPFMILRNIPFISDFAQKERLYLSELYTPQIISYTEIGYGIGNRFFNAGIFGSFHKLTFRQFGVRASFEL